MTALDWKLSVRSLRRAPGFALAAILTLAVAIGLATSVFTVVNAILLRPLPYRDPGRLAIAWTNNRAEGRGPVSFDDFEDWRRDSHTIESAALYSSYYKPILTGAGQAQRLSAMLVSHQYLDVMGVKPLFGRFFTPAEDRDGPDNVVVLTYQFWRTQFHADPQIVGRSILLNSMPHIVLGVAGPDLQPLPPSLASEPPHLYRALGENFGPGSRDGRHLSTLVRLRPGVTLEQAQAELDARCLIMRREHPEADSQLGARIVSLRDDITRNVRGALLGLESAVLLLMLIACANIANLLLARSSARRREMAVRAALGAGIARLAGMLLTESLLLGAAGALCGLVLAWSGTAALSSVAARVLPDAGALTIDSRVLFFSLGVSLAATLLFGIAPILQLNSTNPEDALRFGTRVAGDARHRLRQCLAAGQIALALVLLVSAGLLGRSFLRLRSIHPGFEPAGVLAASVAPPSVHYSTETAILGFFDHTLEALRATPGVRQATTVSVVPLAADFDRTGFVVEGKTFAPGEAVNPDRYVVGPDYFPTMRIALRQGRFFDTRDTPARTAVCIISETAARQWFPGASPLGQRIRAGSNRLPFDQSPMREVVGVVGDVAQYGLGMPATPQIYIPHTQFARRFMTLIVRTDGDPGSLVPSVRQAVFSVDPEQPVYNVAPLEEILSNTIATRRLGLWMLALFAAGALTLAAIGIYGVVSYAVQQRIPEFGIRMALGATSANVLRQAVGGAVPMVAAGLAAGIVASLGASRLLAGFLFGVKATDAVTFAVLPLFLAVVAFAACFIPALRAARVDPLIALRYE